MSCYAVDDAGQGVESHWDPSNSERNELERRAFVLLELISSWSPRDHDEGRFLLLSFGYSRELRESVQPGDVLADIFALCARVLRTLQVRFWVHRHGVGMTWNGDLQSTNRACNLVI